MLLSNIRVDNRSIQSYLKLGKFSAYRQLLELSMVVLRATLTLENAILSINCQSLQP